LIRKHQLQRTVSGDVRFSFMAVSPAGSETYKRSRKKETPVAGG
jgi:hypothetical protein